MTSGSMNFEKQIQESFTRLRMKPFENQVETINRVLTAFLVDQKKYVVMCASTGTGKSILGAVIADVIGHLKGSKLASLILMHNNALTKQYHDTFSSFELDRYMQLKGANNYKCGVLSTNSTDGFVSAEQCAKRKLEQDGAGPFIEKHCKSCEYNRLKAMKNQSANVITNFSYYFVDRQYSKIFDERAIVVWDEAHTINDVFCEHNAIYISKERLTKAYEEIARVLTTKAGPILKQLKMVQLALDAGKIDESNYMTYLKAMMAVYKTAHADIQEMADKPGLEMKDYTRLTKIAKKYFNYGCKIGDLLTYKYEHVFEFNEKTTELTVKPVFIGDMFEKTLVHSPFNLFMSATISKEYVTETLQLKESDVEFIRVAPSFPASNKQVIFYDVRSLNYKSMQDPTVIKTICSNTANIVNNHVEGFQENGIILTPSFVIAEKIAEAIRRSKVKVEVFEHKRGEKSEELIRSFKASKKPCVLISPSIYEGVDLPGDLSRYQVIIKAPFPSLGEKRMSYILKSHPTIYELLTIQKIVQGCGRSVRSVDDHAITYILDANAQRLFNSRLNVWRDEFSVFSYQL